MTESQDNVVAADFGAQPGMPPLPFERQEYLRRIEETKRSMATAGVDVLLSVNPANMNYLTGYDGWSFYVHQVVVLRIDHEEPLWIGRQQDANAARATTFLRPENIYGYPDDYVQSRYKHPMDFVADILAAKGWDGGRVGVEMDSYYYTAAAHAALQRSLPNAELKDTDTLVNWVRAIKSPAELEFMHQAARIVEQTMQRAIDSIEPGVRQCDAVGQIYDSAISGTPEYGGDYAAIVPLLPTGPGTSTPHLTWTDQPFRINEATILELAGCRRRYHCPMARTLYLGPASDLLIDAAKIIVEGIGAALEAARPGNTCEQVEAAWREVISRHGLTKESRIGYSTGLNYPPDWGEHTMSLRPGDDTVIQPNMTFHLIPGIWADGWGIEISECFRVTDEGAEPFCDFPRQLIVKD